MMLYKLISPSMVKATIQLPASKSISNRALIINALTVMPLNRFLLETSITFSFVIIRTCENLVKLCN